MEPTIFRCKHQPLDTSMQSHLDVELCIRERLKDESDFLIISSERPPECKRCLLYQI